MISRRPLVEDFDSLTLGSLDYRPIAGRRTILTINLETDDNHIRMFDVPVQCVPTGNGGWRPMLRCPSCGGRAVKLLVIPAPLGLACRTCLGAVYKSTRASPRDRAINQSSVPA